MARTPPLKVALVIQDDPRDPSAWSGVPAGLRAGFEELGIVVQGIPARFPGSRVLGGVIRGDWAERAASPTWARLSSEAADYGVRRAGDVAGVVMIGSGYSLRTSVSTVTYEDMTVGQALRVGDEHVSKLPGPALSRWQARQGKIYGRVRGLCMMSSWAAEAAVRDYAVPRERVHSVGAGRNVHPRFVERDWSRPRYLFVGRDWERKRGAAVVRAFRRVRESYPDAILHLVGGHPRIDVPGVFGHGHLTLGSVEGRNEYLHLLESSTCFVMPSRFEPLGIAYLEAACAGMPSIGTTVGGAREAIAGGGRVVDPDDDADALTRAMLELAEPELARRLGETARARAELFTWRAVAERMLRALAVPGVETSSLAPFLDARDGAV